MKKDKAPKGTLADRMALENKTLRVVKKAKEGKPKPKK